MDPDCPCGQIKSRAQRQERVPLLSLRLVKDPGSLCSKFASYLGDSSNEGIVLIAVVLGVLVSINRPLCLARMHMTLYCCTGKDCSGGRVNLQDFLPGPFPYVPPPPLLAQKATQPQIYIALSVTDAVFHYL